jgi:hypothetical protein
MDIEMVGIEWCIGFDGRGRFDRIWLEEEERKKRKWKETEEMEGDWGNGRRLRKWKETEEEEEMEGGVWDGGFETREEEERKKRKWKETEEMEGDWRGNGRRSLGWWIRDNMLIAKEMMWQVVRFWWCGRWWGFDDVAGGEVMWWFGVERSGRLEEWVGWSNWNWKQGLFSLFQIRESDLPPSLYSSRSSPLSILPAPALSLSTMMDG